MPLLRPTSILAALPLLVLLATVPGAARAADSPASAAAAKGAPREVVPFIEDDFDRALAEARKRNVPLIVDAWATWCHACRSMRAYVFTDPRVAPLAERAVWLALDVEKPGNAKARKAYPARALPTFFVVDPKDGAVATRWVGGMTVEQLTRFVADGEAAIAAARPAGGETPLARAERAYAAADYATAAGAFVEALATPPADPAADARAVEAALFSLSIEERNEEGLAVARAALARLGRTTSGASAAAQGLGFALALPDTFAGRAATVHELEAATRSFLDDPSVAMSDDDRSGLLGMLLSARQDAKDEAGARKAAEEWAAFLAGAAERAGSAEQRAVFDSHRLSAHLELGTPEKVVPVLEASEKEHPGDYNPPFRLAVAFNALKRWDDALAASARALPLAYGPRKIRIYTARADAFAGKGDVAGAQAVLDEALAYARALPEGQASEATLASLQKKRDGLGATSAR